jgi:hypothetical protein
MLRAILGQTNYAYLLHFQEAIARCFLYFFYSLQSSWLNYILSARTLYHSFFSNFVCLPDVVLIGLDAHTVEHSFIFDFVLL